MALVKASGEVAVDGLEGLVKEAATLAFLRTQGHCLVGIAGLKRPRPGYRTRVACLSKYDLPKDDYPLELGWVFILPSARGNKCSLPLSRATLEAAGNSGVFATSATGKGQMHATLEKLGFVRRGRQYASKRREESLQLFVRAADSAQPGVPDGRASLRSARR